MSLNNLQILKSRILALFMFASFAFPALAYDFKVDDFQYNIINISDKTAEIVGTTNNECEQVTVPSEVTYNGKTIHVVSIGEKVFSNNQTLKSVVIGDGIRKINNSFYACKNLTNVELGAATDTLIRAFEYCHSLENITFKSSNCYISIGTFLYCEKISVINIPSIDVWCSYEFEGYLFRDCENDVSLYVQGKPVVSVDIPNGVTRIDQWQFAGLTTIKEINLPQSLRVIEEGAFAKSGVSNISIPENCDSIMDHVFQGVRLEKLVIPANVKYLGQLGGGYYSTYGATIGELIFEETTDTITIHHTHVTGSSSYQYGSDYMDGMTISEVQLRRPIKGLYYSPTHYKNGFWITDDPDPYSSAFYGYKDLKRVVLGKYFDEIHEKTFSGCSGLDALIIEDADMPITFSQNYSAYTSEFSDCPLTYVYIGRNIIYKSIHMNTDTRPSPFSSKKTVKEVVIGDNVETLPDENLFKDCPIENICIGKKLQEIPAGTFSHTENSLKGIMLFNENPPTYTSGFSNYDYVNCKLGVLYSAMEVYKSSEPWCNFWNISELYVTGIDNVTTEQCPNKHDIYTITGVKVATPSKGIYIVDGKKVLYK